MRIKIPFFITLILFATGVLAQSAGNNETPGSVVTPGNKENKEQPVNSGAVNTQVKQTESSGTIELPKTESEVALENFNKAQVFQSQKEYKSALENYDKAVELDSVFYEAYVARAGIRFLLLDFESALADYNRAIAITEKKSGQFQKTGDIKKVLDDLKGARQDYEKVAYLKTRMGDIYYKRGSVKRFMDDKAGGCEDLKKAKELGAFKANPELKNFCEQ